MLLLAIDLIPLISSRISCIFSCLLDLLFFPHLDLVFSVHIFRLWTRDKSSWSLPSIVSSLRAMGCSSIAVSSFVIAAHVAACFSSSMSATFVCCCCHSLRVAAQVFAVLRLPLPPLVVCSSSISASSLVAAAAAVVCCLSSISDSSCVAVVVIAISFESIPTPCLGARSHSAHIFYLLFYLFVYSYGHISDFFLFLSPCFRARECRPICILRVL